MVIVFIHFLPRVGSMDICVLPIRHLGSSHLMAGLSRSWFGGEIPWGRDLIRHGPAKYYLGTYYMSSDLRLRYLLLDVALIHG